MTETREIGAIDGKILKDLLMDGRKSFTEIATESGTTKNIVWKHFREMAKAGIIVGSTIQMNYASFGYYAVGTVSFQVEPEMVDQAIEYAQKIPNIYGAMRIGRSSSILVIATLKNIEELDRVRDALKKLPSASGLLTNVWTGIRNIPENLSITTVAEKNQNDAASFKKSIASEKKNESKIGEIDNQIVAKLSKNGRMSFKKIAEEINSSTNTVARRYDKLKQSGVIKVSIQIDPYKLGYYATAWFSIESAKNSLLSIADKIAKIPDVTLILKISGRHDLSVTAMIKDIGQLLAVKDEITCIDGVSKVETSVDRVIRVMPGPREYISTF